MRSELKTLHYLERFYANNGRYKRLRRIGLMLVTVGLLIMLAGAGYRAVTGIAGVISHSSYFVGGLLFGVGLVYWPSAKLEAVLRKYVDIEAIRRRIDELET